MQKNKDTLQTGVHSFRKGDLDHASQIFQQHLEQYPEDPQAHLWMGNVHLLDNELKKAKVAFRNVLQLGDTEQQQQALHQLRAIQLNHILQTLLIEPPLRILLFLALICYGLSYFGLQIHNTSLQTFAYWGQFLSIFVFLPLFFFWSLFIIAYFVRTAAFNLSRKDLWALLARTITGLISIGFICSIGSFWWKGGVAWLLSSIACGFFLISLCISWFLQRTGQQLIGEVSPLLLYTLFDLETAFSPEKAMQHNTTEQP